MKNMKAYIEFPAGEVRTYKVEKRDPVWDEYTVVNIERHTTGGAVHILSKNEEGCEKTQYFCGVPLLVVEGE